MTPYHAAWSVLACDRVFSPSKKDWANLAPLLLPHKLMGQAWAIYQKQIPRDCAGIFQSEWKNQWVRNSLMLAELERLLKGLNQESVLAVPLKGAALLDDLYPDRGSRFMSDIDLWFPNRDIQKAQNVLHKMGAVQRAEPKWQANEHKSVMELSTPAGTIVLELHEKLLPFENEKNIL